MASVQVEFDSGCVGGQYQRNNKDSGQKNLRCFPKCDSRGHVKYGFCGSALTMSIERVNGVARESLFSWAEFSLADKSTSTVKVGDVYSRSYIEENLERSRRAPGRQWIKGTLKLGSIADKMSSDAKDCFIFNKERFGWHYGWTSNVHTCDSVHVVRAYVFTVASDEASGKDAGDRLRCVAVQDSPSFKIFCSRRRQRKGKAGAASAKAKSSISVSSKSVSSLADAVTAAAGLASMPGSVPTQQQQQQDLQPMGGAQLSLLASLQQFSQGSKKRKLSPTSITDITLEKLQKRSKTSSTSSSLNKSTNAVQVTLSPLSSLPPSSSTCVTATSSPSSGHSSTSSSQSAALSKLLSIKTLGQPVQQPQVGHNMVGSATLQNLLALNGGNDGTAGDKTEDFSARMMQVAVAAANAPFLLGSASAKTLLPQSVQQVLGGGNPLAANPLQAFLDRCVGLETISKKLIAGPNAVGK